AANPTRASVLGGRPARRGPAEAAMSDVTLALESPRQADVGRLLGALDAYQSALYPAESNHFLDVDALAAPTVRFLVAGGTALRWVAPPCASIRTDTAS